MKVTVLLISLAFAGCALASEHGSQDRTITQVVKLLQGMLDKSKADGDTERELYAKYKCYCDTQTQEKTESIANLKQQIEMLNTDIQGLQAKTGVLSTECANLKAAMAENEEARNTATALRNKEHEDFVAAEEDMVGAIGQMKEAIETLAAVGADQTLNTAADHTKFMAGYSSPALLGLKAKITQALTAASAFLPPPQQRSVASFIQAPFTGNYASQSGQVVGILKNMLDTFENNLASARATEAAQLKAYDAFMADKLAAYNEMSASYDSKQEAMGTGDEQLATAREQLATAEASLANDEEFLALLTPMCAEKAKQYEKRQMLRRDEETAISEAIAILNSDAAFATFGKVDATSTGSTGPSFMQIHKIDSTRLSVKQALQKAKSQRVAKIAALLDAENPFDTVLAEIEKMLKLIEEEGKGDQENLNWCNSERVAQNAALDTAIAQIQTLTGEIATLTDTIENPETGLLVMISNDEASLEENMKSQTTETETRTEENKAYQADIANLVQSEQLLKGAIAVLKKYYARMEAQNAGTGLLQKKEEPAPPETWDSAYSGQSEPGNSAIDMLEYILSENQKEETEAHQAENEAQTAYEDSMAGLKEEEASLRKNLAELRENLAATQKELQEKNEEKKNTEAQKAAIEAYLLKIKPGCDFITANFDLRESHRATETEALNNAIELIKGTPAYMTAVAAQHQEDLGDCQSVCTDEEQVVCKACLAKVTIPGYCAGHPDTAGCDAVAAEGAA